MIGFVDHLRENDSAVGSAETETALRLFEDERWLTQGQTRLGLRILLTSRREEWQRFDDLFEAYWHRRGRLREHKPSKPGAATGKQHPEIWQDHLDLRRTIRANLSRGGEPIDLIQQRKPDRPVRIVVFLDVSGSMQPHSRFFLQFVKGLACRWIDTDAYLFQTRLLRVTSVHDRDSIRAMSRLALMAEGFGGGTRLGACLKAFNDRYVKPTLDRRTVFLCLSDGYDTGSCDDLVDELRRLGKRVPRIVWLNPLLGWEGYEPINRAMTAAMPLIDHFAAAHTLEALAATEPDLAGL